MKRIIWIFFLAFVFCGCYSGVYSKKVTSAAQNQESSESFLWDFGKIKEGEVFKHEFNFKNITGKTLTIKDVRTSCGCTVSEVKSKTLAPQENTSIEVKFNSKGYSGQISQYVYVNTDSAENPVYKFTIKAFVVK